MGEWAAGCRAHAVLGVQVGARWLTVERIVERAVAHYTGDEAQAERRCQHEAVHACRCCGGPALRTLTCKVCSQ